ncbi:keratin-associated protein 5-1-like [Macrobrachium nipponense]|uniref:keratin-associated protein 5-1-like n=1 Tax=Macrobrachium nipponense TaxID=159736 RepID=UPI0030C8B3C2
MCKWITFLPVLIVLWAGAVVSTEVERRAFELEDTERDEEKANEQGRFFGIFRCDDKGCENQGGECGQHWFNRCKRRINGLCEGICTCCIPCGGSCGSNNTGICRTSCSSSEYEAGDNNKCGNFGCSCCERKPDCGGACGADGSGTCKLGCDPSSERKISGTCKHPACECCQPKPGCEERCGQNNHFYCRRKNACSFWDWRIGSCPGNNCRCCRK